MYTLSRLFYRGTIILIFFFFLIPLVSYSQTTEGREFWVTFMRADDDNPQELSLTISTKKECEVVIENPLTDFKQTISITNADNGIKFVSLDKSVCYVGSIGDCEQPVEKGLKITSTEDISLFAGNHRDKSFDVANVLPTQALLSEYIVQAYPPSDHESKNQGSHFAIVAVEDSTVVDFVPTARTIGMDYGLHPNFTALGDTLSTDTLSAGQVYYVWTGYTKGDAADLSGTYIKARDNKKIAVFNGNPHTNVPHEIRDRDHLYEQAMPTAYWGTQFALTASLTRKIDKVRVLALHDGTEVWKNGTLIHTFDFSTPVPSRPSLSQNADASVIREISGMKRTFEFELAEGETCYIETSCPCAVHLFLVSNRYDFPKSPYGDGDPSMIWVNPIEQVIEEITFATFKNYNHYVNIVTDTINAKTMLLDGTSIANDFLPLTGNDKYMYTRKNISSGTHTLKGDKGFIAHAYGFGSKESYGYSVGGATKLLEQSIVINGEVFSPNKENKLCGIDTIHFSCDLNYDVENITWSFGDGTPIVSGKDLTSVKHFYSTPGVYDAYVLVERLSSNLCVGQLAKDSIAISVSIEEIKLQIDSISEFVCASEGIFYAYYSNEGTGLINSAVIKFDPEAKAQGFVDGEITVTDSSFEIPIPATIESAKSYTAEIILYGDCIDETISFNFMANYAATDIFTQRWNDVLAIKNSTENGGHEFTSFQWYKNDKIMSGETRSYIYVENEFNTSDEYYVKLVNVEGLELCTCKKKLEDQSEDDNKFKFLQEINVEATNIKATSLLKIDASSTGIVRFRDLTGNVVSSVVINKPTDYVQVPDKVGFHLMDICLDNGERKVLKINVNL